MIFSTRKWQMICLLVTLFILAPLTVANASSLTAEVKDVPVNKTWTITFNHPVIEPSVTENSIYVMNSKNVKQKVKTVVKDHVVTIHPPEAGYEVNQKYTLHITTAVLGQVGQERKSLKQPIIKPFTTTEGGYVVVNIKADGTYSPVANYATFDAANAKLQKDQGIMLNNKYIKIPAGFVATNANGVTNFYTKEDFKNHYAGVSKDTELVYVDATANYVKVHVAGQDMYVKPEDVTLIPKVAAKGQSYYKADQQGLWHSIYHHHSGKYDAPYLVGKKPSFLKTGVNYYSADGAKFYDVNGTVMGESYSYFQYVSPRVTTSYSAAELDQYIAKELQAREKSSNAKYANATTKSPLKGLGATLKTIEKDKNINALLILALAIHESDYGMSCHAQNYNNLFGLNVVDSNDTCSTTVDTSSDKYFKSIELNIAELVNRFNTNYLNPLNMGSFRYNGVALGNKMIGINVFYATDPHWGAKAAGHMYRIDQALGSKDYQQYKVGITTQKDVSVRKTPEVINGTNNNRVYQYKIAGTIKRLDQMPITLSNTLSQKDGWLRIISELPKDNTDLYTSADNVRIVPTH